MTLKSARSLWLVALIYIGFVFIYFSFVLVMRAFGFLPASFAFYLCFINLLAPILAISAIFVTQIDTWAIRLLFFAAVALLVLSLIEVGIRLLLALNLFVLFVLFGAAFIFAIFNGLIAFFAYKCIYVVSALEEASDAPAELYDTETAAATTTPATVRQRRTMYGIQ